MSMACTALVPNPKKTFPGHLTKHTTLGDVPAKMASHLTKERFPTADAGIETRSHGRTQSHTHQAC